MFRFAHFGILSGMTHAHAPRSTSAATAIAAVLALASTPALAQVASPAPADPVPVVSPVPTATSASTTMPLDITSDAPQPAPSTTPSAAIDAGEPVVLLPDTNAPIASSSPVIDAPAPEAPTTQTTAARSGTPRSTAVTTPAAAAPASVPTPDAPGTAADGALADGDVAADALPLAVSEPVDQGEAAITTPDQDGDALPITGIVGLLAALGIAGAGAVAMRRRKVAVMEAPHSDRVARAPLEPERRSSVATDMARVSPAPAPFVAQQRIASPRPTSAEIMSAPAPRVAAAVDTPPVAAGRPGTSLGVLKAIGDRPVPHGEDREALVRRIVAAEPDGANPYRSRKARRRRARIQLKHHETLQSRGEPFDWRTYKPTTRSSPASSPELVPA